VFGVVGELLVVEKQLFAGCEHKLGAAIVALQNSIDKVHRRLPQGQGMTMKSAMIPKCLPVPYPCARTAINIKGPGRRE
jgi:hypothetical protein